jgi:hypothetical protein
VVKGECGMRKITKAIDLAATRSNLGRVVLRTR